MRTIALTKLLVFLGGLAGACRQSQPAAPVDPSLAAFIATIKAVDNHTHANTIARPDSEADALPLDGLPPFPLPVRLRPDHPEWLAAYRALYDYGYQDLSEAHLAELRTTMQRVAQEQGDRFPVWVLDRIGTEVMLANRIALGPGLAPPRFRWVGFADPLMLPLSTADERTATPDYQALYPLEERLLRRYLGDLGVSQLPASFDAYLRTVVTPTLEKQRQAGAVAVKFEAAYLRPLDFDDATAESAARIYGRYVTRGKPSHAEYKTLQDFLFRYIARESGRLGMAVHIHSLEGAGGYYRAGGSDPLLLESAFNDSSLRRTNFVIVHGGGMYADHARAMLWKPNVYVDCSLMSLLYPPAVLAQVLAGWLRQFPEKVLFGSDAFGGGPDAGWELAAWLGSTNSRQALGLALTDMMEKGEITRPRAEAIATMVLRGNANTLYDLKLP